MNYVVGIIRVNTTFQGVNTLDIERRTKRRLRMVKWLEVVVACCNHIRF